MDAACKNKFENVFYNIYSFFEENRDVKYYMAKNTYKTRKKYSPVDLSCIIDPYIDTVSSIKNAKDQSLLNYVSDYAKFLRIAEKCLYFKNSKEEDIYSETNDTSTTLYLEFDDYSIVINKELTKLDLLNNDDNIDTFMLLGEREKLSFNKITISRKFGKEMETTFKFISNSKPIFNDESDHVIYLRFENIVRKAILKSFENIIDKVVTSMNVSSLVSYCECMERIRTIYPYIRNIEYYGGCLWIEKKEHESKYVL